MRRNRFTPILLGLLALFLVAWGTGVLIYTEYLWFKEVGQLNNALKKFNPQGRVLEIACGTGWWTQELLKYADSITALDPSPEVLEINQKKLNSLIVRYVQADIFAWKPKVQYDVVFFSFWISHVPPKLFKKFWNIVHSALTPDGRVFFIDNFQSEKDLMAGKQFKGLRSIVSLRKVKDEREFNVIKIFYVGKD